MLRFGGLEADFPRYDTQLEEGKRGTSEVIPG